MSQSKQRVVNTGVQLTLVICEANSYCELNSDLHFGHENCSTSSFDGDEDDVFVGFEGVIGGVSC